MPSCNLGDPLVLVYWKLGSIGVGALSMLSQPKQKSFEHYLSGFLTFQDLVCAHCPKPGESPGNLSPARDSREAGENLDGG
jgi:hypothetical protein